MKNSIVFYGWYGAGNLGDELLLASLLTWARKEKLKAVVISYDVAYTQRIHDLQAVDVEDIPAIVHAVTQSVACVLGGGGIFQTHHNFSYAGLFHFGVGDIAAYARPLLLAQQLGVPHLLIGQGVGPLDNEAARGIVCEVFNKAKLVTARDTASLELLKEVGVTSEVVMAPDLVWTIPIDNQGNGEMRQSNRLRIAMVIRPWLKSPGFEERMISAIKSAIDPLRFTLVWIPFQNHSIPYRSSSDIAFVQQCMDKFGPDWNQELITEEVPQRIIHAFSSCDVVVAMRLHAQILGFKLGKPTLSVEYDNKMTELANQVQQVSTLRIRPNDDLHLWQRALECLCYANSSPGYQHGKIEELESEAAQHFQLLDTFIATLPNTEKAKRQIRLQDINWFEYWLIWIGKQVEARTNQGLVERDGQIARLNQALTERDEQIARLNQALIERDEQIASLNQVINVLHGKLNQLNTELIKIRQSASWRVRSLGRIAKRFFASPKRTTYEMARIFYRRLPANLRQALHGPRHAFIRFVAKLPSPEAQNKHNILISDLSWEDFRDNVIFFRERYKGVFVQDLVIDWNVPLYQRPQHISTALGSLGYLVIYRTGNWAGDNVNGFREVSRNVWITNRREADEIPDVVRSFYSTAYANTPELLLKNGRRGTLVYEYIDHIDQEISGDRENINRLVSLKKFAFSGGADFVVASAMKLYDEAVEAIGKDKVILVPNGVDTTHYRNPIHQFTSLPSSLIEFKKKYKAIVGYFGALAPWLWYECIEELCRIRPNIGFVFIGPDYYGGVSKLPNHENLLYLGSVDYKILPAYGRLFDICFIPFKPGEIARTTSPLKLFEYFALEKPVVVTSDMDECTAYHEVFRGNSTAELGSAIDEALLVKDNPSFVARLRCLADQNDWSQRALAFEAVFTKYT